MELFLESEQMYIQMAWLEKQFLRSQGNTLKDAFAQRSLSPV